jgi:hypothetical protein
VRQIEIGGYQSLGWIGRWVVFVDGIGFGGNSSVPAKMDWELIKWVCQVLAVIPGWK